MYLHPPVLYAAFQKTKNNIIDADSASIGTFPIHDNACQLFLWRTEKVLIRASEILHANVEIDENRRFSHLALRIVSVSVFVH